MPTRTSNVLAALEADCCLPAETRRERGSEIGYGRHGSLSVDLRAAVWRDHEAGEDGGLLALVERRTGQHGPDYLRDRGIRGFEDRNRRPERPRKRRMARKRP